VIAPPTEEPAPISLRLHCRLTANDELGVSVKIKGAAKSVLLDISAGGMLVFFPGATPYAVGERLGYRLIFRQGGVIRGQADVRDAFEMQDTDAPLHQAGAVARLKFLSRDIADTRLLDRTLHRAMFLLVDS
jgi:c-di-GMP-binding flagellar brake protein YcgR